MNWDAVLKMLPLLGEGALLTLQLLLISGLSAC